MKDHLPILTTSLYFRGVLTFSFDRALKKKVKAAVPISEMLRGDSMGTSGALRYILCKADSACDVPCLKRVISGYRLVIKRCRPQNDAALTGVFL